MYQKMFSIFLAVFLLNSICIPAHESSAAEFIQQEKTTEILGLLAFTGKGDEISKKWEKFLRERNHRFGNKDYQMAIHNLKSEYDQSYAQLNACVENTNKETEQYSSSWTKDFRERFDREYIQKNFDSIRFVVIALAVRNSLAYCDEQVKEALYREYSYLDAAKNYVEYFTEFSKTLNEDEKKKLSVQIKTAEGYLNSFEYPLQSTLSGEGLKDALFSDALKTHKDLDPQLIGFFTHQQFFMKPFALVKTLNDLKALR
jgi:uncharacterized protein YukE